MGNVFYTASLRISTCFDFSVRKIYIAWWSSLRYLLFIMGYFQWCLVLGLVSAVCVLSVRSEMTQVDGAMKTVSASSSGVWGISTNDQVFVREGTYGSTSEQGLRWTKVNKNLIQVDAGASSVWGVNVKNKVFYRSAISANAPAGKKWIFVDGDEMQHVSVSDKGRVWATDLNNVPYKRIGASESNTAGNSWEATEGSLVKVSVGDAGVWGVNKHNQVYYREGTYGDVDTIGTDWIFVGSYVNYVSSCRDAVMAVNTKGEVLVREGITADSPTGDSWAILPGKLSSVDCTSEGKFWGVGLNNEVFMA